MSYYREEDRFHTYSEEEQEIFSEHAGHDGTDPDCAFCEMEREALKVANLDAMVRLFMVEPMYTWERESAERAI